LPSIANHNTSQFGRPPSWYWQLWWLRIPRDISCLLNWLHFICHSPCCCSPERGPSTELTESTPSYLPVLLVSYLCCQYTSLWSKHSVYGQLKTGKCAHVE
jgi:hypothetical protein